mmetsp:Transcript_5616/g.14224  ORF Transcript_5616/g.14224 Transcript_5616/m.14224 type:complete len:296 (+) Transcript_5616:919-1806(+)
MGCEPAAFLHLDDLGHVQAAGHHQHDDQCEAHRDFVRHHLRRRAQGAEEGVLGVRCPAGDDDAVDLERGDGHQEQQAGIDVRDRGIGAEGHDGPGGERRHDGHHGAEEEQALAGRRRLDDLLEDQLHRIGNRGQQPPGANTVRARADLRPADGLALPQRQVSHAEQQRQQHRDDLHQAPDHGPDSPEQRSAVLIEGVDHSAELPQTLLMLSVPKAAPRLAVWAMPVGTRATPSGRPASSRAGSCAAPPSCTMRTWSPSPRPSCCHRPAGRPTVAASRPSAVSCSEVAWRTRASLA